MFYSNIRERQLSWAESLSPEFAMGLRPEWSHQSVGMHPNVGMLNDLRLMEPSLPYEVRYLDLRQDRVFKYVFGKVENRGLLIDLLNNILDGRRKINSLLYGSVERQGNTKGTRVAQFDLQCTSDSGEQFLIEMQREGEEGFFRRLLYYTMRLGGE